MEDDESTPKREEYSDEEVKKILKDALALKLVDTKDIPSRNQLSRALKDTLGEFLTCYRIIGYDYEGKPVNMVVYKEDIEKSALDNAFMEEIGKFMGTRI